MAQCDVDSSDVQHVISGEVVDFPGTMSHWRAPGVLVGNELPAWPGASGMSRRIRLIPFLPQDDDDVSRTSPPRKWRGAGAGDSDNKSALLLRASRVFKVLASDPASCLGLGFGNGNSRVGDAEGTFDGVTVSDDDRAAAAQAALDRLERAFPPEIFHKLMIKLGALEHVTGDGAAVVSEDACYVAAYALLEAAEEADCCAAPKTRATATAAACSTVEEALTLLRPDKEEDKKHIQSVLEALVELRITL